MSNSAGVATLAADACATRGLEVREASDAQNPLVLGVGAGPDEYAASIRELLGDVGIDALMVYYVDHHDGDPEAVLEAISAVSEGQPKPVVASVVRSDGRLPTRNGSGVPNFLFPESCAAVLARAAERREWLSRPLGEPPHYRRPGRDGGARADRFVSRSRARGRLAVARRRGSSAGHARNPGRRLGSLPRSRGRGRGRRAEIGGPVALKADFAAPAHASDIDAVLLGLEGEAAVRSGWRELERRVQTAGREWTGAIVQRLVAPGADVLVGAVSDPDLGSVIAVGLGGRQAGLAETVAFRLPPITDTEADELIDASEGVATELDGFRGSPSARSRGAARADPALRPAARRGPRAGRGRPQPRPLHDHTAASCSTCDCESSAGAQSSASRPGKAPPRRSTTCRPGARSRGPRASRRMISTTASRCTALAARFGLSQPPARAPPTRALSAQPLRRRNVGRSAPGNGRDRSASAATSNLGHVTPGWGRVGS